MKEKMISYILSIYLILMFIFGIMIPDNKISESERRPLKQFDSTNFSEDFENYALDQFPLRDTFRSFKSYFNLYILNNKDNNKLVLKDGNIYKLETTNNKSILKFIEMINYISKDNPENLKYIAVAPDKAYFLSDNYPKMNYEYIFNSINNINNIVNIPLYEVLSIDDYYKTDPHWKQSKLMKVVDILSKYMNFNYNDNYIINKYNNYKGLYYGQLGLNINTDTLEYLTSETINNVIVEDLEHPEQNKVYNLDKLNTFEPYDIYLNGSAPLITITNNDCESEKEIIVFRDSYGSSLVPLLIDSYKKITLVDLRYIDYNVLSHYIDINNQDILFLYSTTIINNSGSLKY